MLCRIATNNIKWCKGVNMSIFYSDVLPKIEKWLLEELSGPEKEGFSKKTKTLVELADKIATILEHSSNEKIDRTFPIYLKKDELVKDELVFIRRVTRKVAEKMGIVNPEQLSDKALTDLVLKKLEENSLFSESLPQGSIKPYGNHIGFVRALFYYSKTPIILSASCSITLPSYSAP